MGNGVSTDQGSIPAHGKRDVREKADTRQYNWSELAEAPITKQPTKLSPVVSQSQKPYIDASNVGPSSSSSTEDNAHVDVDTYNGAQLRDQKSQKSSRKSPSRQPAKENSSSDEEDGEVVDVRAEDNGHRGKRKKSSLDARSPSTSSETALRSQPT